MENICEKEYASFMEEVLQHMVRMPVSSLCVLIKLEDGSVYSNYFNTKMMDKMIYAGVIQQDVTWEILKKNNSASNLGEEASS